MPEIVAFYDADAFHAQQVRPSREDFFGAANGSIFATRTPTAHTCAMISKHAHITSGGSDDVPRSSLSQELPFENIQRAAIGAVGLSLALSAMSKYKLASRNCGKVILRTNGY